MRRIFLGASACVAVAAAWATAFGATAPEVRQKPLWAYGIPTTPPIPALEVKGYSLPGTGKTFTPAKINGLDRNDLGIGDWYPSEHPPMPKIVSHGNGWPDAGSIAPCGQCHSVNGTGRSENAPLAGQPRDYLIATLHDIKAGLRKSSEPAKENAALMEGYAKAMTEDEIVAAATYFSSLPWIPWVKVVETAKAPKVRSVGGLYVPLEGVDAGEEPIGQRIVEVPVDFLRTRLRDPHSGFIAYVPVGSVAKGKALVTTGGGKTMACSGCHGADLSGVGSMPSIAGRSPSYMARQINDYQRGARNGPMAVLMKPVVENLTEDDIVNITAFLASIPVKPVAGS